MVLKITIRCRLASKLSFRLANQKQYALKANLSFIESLDMSVCLNMPSWSPNSTYLYLNICLLTMLLKSKRLSRAVWCSLPKDMTWLSAVYSCLAQHTREALRHQALDSLTKVNFLTMTSFRASIQQGWLQFREGKTFGQLSLSSTMVSSMLPGSWAKVVVIIAAVFIISTVWLLQLNTSVRLVV